eukprot:COSAG01_NODE_1689_length_9488_cov_5.759825_7_plen_198_part_00
MLLFVMCVREKGGGGGREGGREGDCVHLGRVCAPVHTCARARVSGQGIEMDRRLIYYTLCISKLAQPVKLALCQFYVERRRLRSTRVPPSCGWSWIGFLVSVGCGSVIGYQIVSSVWARQRASAPATAPSAPRVREPEPPAAALGRRVMRTMRSLRRARARTVDAGLFVRRPHLGWHGHGAVCAGAGGGEIMGSIIM